MCDKLVSLISSKYAQTILWAEEDNDSEDEDILDVDHDELDQMEDTVTVRKGFKVSSFWFCD